MLALAWPLPSVLQTSAVVFTGALEAVAGDLEAVDEVRGAPVVSTGALEAVAGDLEAVDTGLGHVELE